MRIPIRIYVDLEGREVDTLYHKLDVSVIGNKHSQTVVTIQSNFYHTPRVTEISQDGLHHLDQRLRDELLCKIFRLAVIEMRRSDGSAIDWAINDLSQWIGKQFSSVDATTIEHVLNSFERPEVTVIDRAEVRVD